MFLQLRAYGTGLAALVVWTVFPCAVPATNVPTTAGTDKSPDLALSSPAKDLGLVIAKAVPLASEKSSAESPYVLPGFRPAPSIAERDASGNLIVQFSPVRWLRGPALKGGVCASGKIKLFFPQPESVGPPDLLVPYRSNDLALMEVAVSGDGNLLATKHWSIGAADEQSVCKNELHGFKTVQDLRRMQTPAARIITFSELVDRQETVSLVLVLEMLRDLRPDLQQELRTKLRRAFAKSSKRPGVPDYVAKFIASQILLIPPDKRPSGGPN